MYATLLASANEAAYAVGANVGKNAGHDYNWFVQQMNVRCKELGGNNSHFANTNGLHDPNHYKTCARDMALIGRELFKHPEFFKIVQRLNYTIPKSKTVSRNTQFYQKHKMLWPGGSSLLYMQSAERPGSSIFRCTGNIDHDGKKRRYETRLCCDAYTRKQYFSGIRDIYSIMHLRIFKKDSGFRQ